MKLVRKLVLGKAAANLAGKEVKKAEKKAKKAVKRTVRTVLLMILSFCAGAGLMAWFAYVHRNVIAASVFGIPLNSNYHHGFCLKLPHWKRK